MKQKQCTNLQKPSSFWRSLRLFCTGLILLPLALTLIVIRRSLLLVQKLRIRRPMIKEPIHFIRSESVEQIDDWKNYDDEKKTIEIARYLAELNFHLPNKQNNEQFKNKKKFPDIPYDDAIQ